MWRALNNLPMLVDSLASAATVHVYTGEYDEAIAFSEEALQLSQSISYVWGQSHSRFMVGYAYWEQGRIDQALATMQESIRLSEVAGFLPPQVITRANLAALYGSLGAFEPGLETIQRALTVANTQNFRVEALTVLARLKLRQGNLAEARAHLDESKRNEKQAVFPLFSAFGALTESELYLKQGDHEQARGLIETLLADLRQSGMWAHIPTTLHLHGQILLALGQNAVAYERLVEARDAAEAIGSQRTLWPILMTLSQIEPDPITAAPLKQQARSIVEDILAHTSLPELRASFLKRPQVQVVLKTSPNL